MFKILPGTVHTACGRLRERSWPDAFTRLSLASPVRDSFLFLSAKGNVHCIIFLIAITIVTIILGHFKMFLKLTSLHLKLQGPTMLNHLTNKSNISLHSTRRSTASYAEGDTNSGSPGRAGAARGPAGQRTRGSVPARCGSPGGSAVPLAPPPAPAP